MLYMDLGMILAIVGTIGTAATLADLGYKYGPNLLKKLKERSPDRVRESAQIEPVKTSSLYPNLLMLCPQHHHFVPPSLLKKI